MSQSAVAKRYALALFQLASEKQSIDALQEELDVVEAVFAQNDDLIEVLTHPKISTNRKKT